MAEVLAVCISEVRGISKHSVKEIHLIPEHGIEGDAHAGKWHRQVSLLAQESVDNLQSKITIQLKPGDFAENILTRGIELKTLPVGDPPESGHCTGRSDSDRERVPQ